jgi:hypothetical protein
MATPYVIPAYPPTDTTTNNAAMRRDTLTDAVLA